MFDLPISRWNIHTTTIWLPIRIDGNIESKNVVDVAVAALFHLFFVILGFDFSKNSSKFYVPALRAISVEFMCRLLYEYEIIKEKQMKWNKIFVHNSK